jgi:hypothetical protein
VCARERERERESVRADAYVFMAELTIILLKHMLHYALNDWVCAVRQDFHSFWTGVILSASLHYCMVSENPKTLYLIRAGSCLP